MRTRGVSAVLYPEGTRARRGELGPFRPAGVRTLLGSAPEAPVVPVTIDESWRLLRNNLFPVPFATRIRVHIGAPIERRPGEDHRALIAELNEYAAKVLEGWRSGASA